MTITFHPDGTMETGGVSTVINKPAWMITGGANMYNNCLLYTSPSPRDS